MAAAQQEKETHSENYQEIYKKIKSIIPENHQAFYLNMIKEWKNNYGDAVFIDLLPNNLGENLLSIYHYKTIYLIGPSYPTVLYAPKIMFQFYGPQHIHIDDVLMRTNNVGNGSVAMNGLIQYSKLIGVNTITGYLSEVDDDHKNRRNHFYEKFGFNVREKNIKLSL